MIGGAALVGALYLLVSVVYLRALPIETIGASTRIGEQATTALLGPGAGSLLAGAVLVSIFGCLASATIASARLGLPMAEDAPACSWLSTIHPRYQTPSGGIVTLAIWSSVLTLSGSYEQLFSYAIFSSILFHVVTGLSLFQLRRTRPEVARPYRTWGYPLVPAVFVLAMTGLVINSFSEQPWQSLFGVGLVALGVPVFRWRPSAITQPRSLSSPD